MQNRTDYSDLALLLRCKKGKVFLRKISDKLKGKTITGVHFGNQGYCISAMLAFNDGSTFATYDPALTVYELREKFEDAIEDEYHRERTAKRPERRKA